MVVWGCDGADPSVAALECRACAGARGAAACVGGRASGRRSGSGGSARGDGDSRSALGCGRTGGGGGGAKGCRSCGRSVWFTLGMILVDEHTGAPRCACFRTIPANAAAF